MIWRNTILINEQELLNLTRKNKAEQKKKLSKKEYDRRIVEWQLFYLNNLDIFNEEYLGLKLKYFQKQILHICWEDDIIDIIASRGLSKYNKVLIKI